MTTNYILSANELNESFLKAVKTMFGKKEIIISISDGIDETEYLLSSTNNKKNLKKSIQQLEKGEDVVFSGNSFVKEAKKIAQKN
ncbi:MAG: hypothetical protein RIQ33_1019 [Bacteroidota bacterium]|jgi:hypothetical protein